MKRQCEKNVIFFQLKPRHGPLKRAADQSPLTNHPIHTTHAGTEDDAAHVFDRFYRSPRARTRPGNGIGLAIVRQVADVHGGRTWVRETPGGGATIGLSLAPTD